MATESLNVPEDDLAMVVAIIRAGIKAIEPPDTVKGPLLAWCDDIEEYLQRIGGDDE